MNYIYIIVPVCFSPLIFTLTVGYLLLVKYKASRLLKSIRRGMIMEHCSPEFVSKAPDMTYGHVPFTGVYRQPSMSTVQQVYFQNQPLPMLSENGGCDSVHTFDANSDVIEVPLRPYIHHSSSSSEAMGGAYYGRSAYYNRYKSIEQGDSGTVFESGRAAPLEYRKHQFVDEFGPANVYCQQEY
ncbi:unnamed protein product [Taenia asiatica]|uniref:Uncharacterized protein n=1 Tax=Taenia asiatica TaxID=60517 RepID=A0A0R3WGS5_TAEAS|nr:unnamed protein product [Taenia asiatica]